MDDEKLKLLLARAFDRAWSRYYRPGRVTIPAELARTALANHLVQVAKNGIIDEDQLVASSLMHLISLAPNEPKSS